MLLAAVRSPDRTAFELGERYPGEPAAIVDVRARHVDRAVLDLPLCDLEHMLSARRTDRNEHDAVGLELLHQGWWDVVDAAGDDDPIERCLRFPPVIAVGISGGDGLVFRVAALDEPVVD